MSRRRSEQDRRLTVLYAQVPEIDCKGHCHTQCSMIDMGARERQRLHAAGFVIPSHGEQIAIHNATGSYRCPALDKSNECSAYEIRPMICRIWGVSQGMHCKWGCRPTGRLLSRGRAYALLIQALRVGGEWSGLNLDDGLRLERDRRTNYIDSICRGTEQDHRH